MAGELAFPFKGRRADRNNQIKAWHFSSAINQSRDLGWAVIKEPAANKQPQ
jgi:hypothetical protein